MRILLSLTLPLLLSCLAPGVSHAQFLYGIDQVNDQLILIDRSTGAASIVGPLGFDAAGIGMDFDNSGVLWALIGTNPPELYTISTATGAATYVVEVDASISGRGIAFAPDGVNLYSSSRDELFHIDIATGHATLIGNMGEITNNLASSQAGVFYCTGGGQLLEVDVSDASTTPLGPTSGSIAALTYDDSADKLLSGSTSLYEIDPSNGASVLLGDFGLAGVGVVGMAYLDLATPVSGATWGRVKALYR